MKCIMGLIVQAHTARLMHQATTLWAALISLNSMSLDIYINKVKEVSVFDANYTHNVTPMWTKAGVYESLYESEGKTASEILPTLREGYKQMVDNSSEYEKLNPENGWGSYDGALKFLKEFIKACEQDPDGIIHISA